MTPRLDRRKALGTLGAAGIGGLFAACGGDDDDAPSSATTTTTTSTTAAPATTSGGGLAGRFEDASGCSLTPEETEGPYYLDLDLVRSDIREGQEGVTLTLGIRVLAADCTPISGAVVDVWHCNAVGVYSGYEQASEGGAGGGQTDNETYLRGTQLTDADGIVQFTTIYPGWYRGRTVHIHSKVHLSNLEVLTTQFYFDEDVTSTVYESEPYAADSGRDTFNDDDGLFLSDTVLTLSEESDGYLGLINVTVESADGA